MQVILVEPMKNLGKMWEIVDVKTGYARNFLIPKGKAKRATKENIALLETKKAQFEENNLKIKQQALEISKTISGSVFTVIKQAAEDGRLYGSVNSKEIASLVTSETHAIKASDIVMKDPVKTIGMHKVELALHSEVDTIIFINVARTESEAQEAIKNFNNSSKQE